jgi:low temperature requirement protein LtrA
VAVQDQRRRPTALTYAVVVFIAQCGWVGLAVWAPGLGATAVVATLLLAVEIGGVLVAERKKFGTPWHAEHLAERYSLLTIIALGETLFGTVAAVSAIVEEQGWSTEAVLVLTAGVGLSFGLWWTYFIIPSGEILHRHRGRVWWWSYGHMLVYASIAATGAGIHVAAYVVEGTAQIGTLGAVLAIATPVLLFAIALFSLYTYLVQEGDIFHIALVVGLVLMLLAAVVVAAAGGSLGVCLILVTASPFVVVVGYETFGHRHEEAVLARALN